MRIRGVNNDCSTTDGGLLTQETQCLASDLAGDHKACTIAYWHQPTFTAADTSADVPDPSAPEPGQLQLELPARTHRARLRPHHGDELQRLRHRRLPELT